MRHQCAPLLLPDQRSAFQPFPNASHHQSCYGQEDEHKECQLPADDNHHAEAHDNHNRVFEHHVERCHDGILHFRHVARHASHNVAFALAGEESDRQRNDFVVDVVADVAYDSGADGDEEICAQVGGSCLESGRTEFHFTEIGGIVEVVDSHIFQRAVVHRHIVVDNAFVAHKQHFQNRNNERKGEKRQKRCQNVEEDVEKQVLFIGRYETPQYDDEILHF